MNGRIVLCLLMFIFSHQAPLSAAEREAEQTGGAFSVRWENDAFGDTDANYTNGVALALARKGEGLGGGIWKLFNYPEGERFAAYDFGQLQFTPNDIGRQLPDPRDRPYVGFLYLGVATSLKRDESLHGLKLIAGVVGPASLSESTQKLTHRLLGYNMPRGWDFQLKNEPVVNLCYEYRRKIALLSRDSAVGIEVIPVGEAMLGNFMIRAQAGTQVRLGYQLPDDFGTTVLRGIGSLPFPARDEKRPWGVYAFAGGSASLVARDLTLDGNTFANSPKVDKRIFLPAGEFGASLWTRQFQATFSYVMLGQEFSGQRVREDYGSILVTYFFR